jgi:hypothetical protein
MKFVIFNKNHPGVVVGDKVFDISKLIKWNAKNMHPSLIHFIENFEEYKNKIEESWRHRFLIRQKLLLHL